MTAAATIGAFIYNLTTDLVGGIEITLADRD
ncbi:putative integral membrane protein [Mycobacteroides abscessus subsp. abscessus]|nr:putative integral membrane protein [Mycobacteroides abscessus subsp. abscessus]